MPASNARRWPEGEAMEDCELRTLAIEDPQERWAIN